MLKLTTALIFCISLLSCSCSSSSNWMQTTEGAKIFNAHPKVEETVSWSGKADSKGYADGYGTATWRHSGNKYEVWRGTLSKGKHTSSMKLVDSGEGQPKVQKKIYTKKPVAKTYKSSSYGSQRCTGITQKGTRCKRMVRGGTRCHQHD